jgi:hypothetical protein
MISFGTHIKKEAVAANSFIGIVVTLHRLAKFSWQLLEKLLTTVRRQDTFATSSRSSSSYIDAVQAKHGRCRQGMVGRHQLLLTLPYPHPDLTEVFRAFPQV